MRFTATTTAQTRVSSRFFRLEGTQDLSFFSFKKNLPRLKGTRRDDESQKTFVQWGVWRVNALVHHHRHPPSLFHIVKLDCVIEKEARNRLLWETKAILAEKVLNKRIFPSFQRGAAAYTTLADNSDKFSRAGAVASFSVIVRRKKKVQRDYESARPVEMDKAIRTLQVRLQQQPVKHLEIDGTLKPATLGVLIPYGVEKKYTTPNGKARSPESPIGFVETAFYEGEDEHEGSPLERENCCNDCSHLQTPEANSGEVAPSGKMDLSESDSGDRIQSGHLSDPGVGKAEFWASPKLTRSCSNLETHHKDVVKKMSSKLPASKSQYFEELHELADSVTKDVDPGSPGSELTHFTADKEPAQNQDCKTKNA
ncbi:uncharacterized protein Pyn_24505 [Prunus yedoensis var. nudiflora]|uniref:Uncharacterized protein n=1 Tax=Prunus yedoensis var. nudiflora TaxID=2094558 RepID=A0A314V0N3_PRUYE|nr:uncharacterized protein Pyn_24505 [Prunus yedoensis var. nudiflora]